MTNTHPSKESCDDAASRLTSLLDECVTMIHTGGDLAAESTWVVDKLTPEQYTPGKFVDQPRTDLTGPTKEVIQLMVMQQCDQTSAEAILGALTQNPRLLYPLFKPIAEMIENIPKHGTLHMLDVHVWLVALVRATGSASFLAAPIPRQVDSTAPEDEYMNELNNWLALMCHAGMHQTLEFLYHADRATLQNAWYTTVLGDPYGGPIGRACCAALTNPDSVRAKLTFDIVQRTIVGCAPEDRPASLRTVDSAIVLAQNGGMAMVMLAKHLDSSTTVERVLNRIIEWCPNVIMNVIDEEGFTALARVVERGGRPGIAAKLVARGASLLVTLPKGHPLVEAQKASSKAPKNIDELRHQQYEREPMLLPRLTLDPECKPGARTRRIAAYRAAQNERQVQLKTEVSRVVKEDLKHKPLEVGNIDAPQMRVHVMKLAVTPREADCTYAMVPVATSDGAAQQASAVGSDTGATPRLTREQHQHQMARIVSGAELRGLYTGRIYDQYQMEPEEDQWIVCAPHINPVVPGMMMTMQLVMQNGAAINCATPSTVMVTIVGTGDPLDPYLPRFSPVTVVFHTANYLTYCGLDDPIQEEVDTEAQKITGQLGHEMYKLGHTASKFHPERAASGAASMPFSLLGKEATDAMRLEVSAKSATESTDPKRQNINPRQFVEVIHWEKDPEPAHLVIAQMNVATAVAPVQVQADDVPSLESNGGEVSGSTQNMNMALKFQTLIFSFTILSRSASDIIQQQQVLQEDARLDELDRQERLEQQRKYTSMPETSSNDEQPTPAELHTVKTEHGVVEFQV